MSNLCLVLNGTFHGANWKLMVLKPVDELGYSNPCKDRRFICDYFDGMLHFLLPIFFGIAGVYPI